MISPLGFLNKTWESIIYGDGNLVLGRTLFLINLIIQILFIDKLSYYIISKRKLNIKKLQYLFQLLQPIPLQIF